MGVIVVIQVILLTVIVIVIITIITTDGVREMGGAPRNPAPRNRFLVWIVKPSGRHCTDGHLTSRVLTESQHISYSTDPP